MNCWNAAMSPAIDKNVLLLIFESMFNFGKVKVFSSASFENVQDIQTSGFEMRSSIVRIRYEQLIGSAIVVGRENVTNLNKLLFDGPQQLEAGLDLSLWIVRFHVGRYHSDEPSLGGHLVSVANHGDVDVRLASDLLLGDDNLGGQGILGIGHWVIH